MVSQPQAATRLTSHRPTGRRTIFALLALAASSVLWFWGTGLHPIWWLTWLAPLPILLASTRVRGWSAFGLSTLSFFVGTTNQWRYMLKFIELPLHLVLIFSILPSLLFGVAVLLFRRFAVRGALWRAALVFPAFWVSLEYLNNITSPHGTFSNLGYTQMDFLPVLQVTSVVGIWGISFCLFLFSAAIAALLGRNGSLREKKRVAIAAVAFFALVLGFGWWRLISSPVAERSVRVALMATGTDTTFPHNHAAALSLMADYANKSDSLAAQGAQVIVLPEKIAVVSDEATSQLDSLYSSAASREKTTVLVGLDRGTLTKRWNEARLYSPDGTLEATYDKHHMVPVMEDVDQRGTTITTFEQPSGIWGIQICKDMDFPGLSRQYGARGVGLLLVPAWDFNLDGWLHGRMAIMRGVENGFTIVRSAKQGVLTVSDHRGRVLAQKDDAVVPWASLLATAPVHHDNTLYTRWGDWFAWLNVVLLIALIFIPPGKQH